MHKAVLPTVKPTIEKEGHKGSTDDDLEIDEDKPEDFDEGEDEDEEDEDEDDLDNEGLGGGLDGEDDLGTDLHSHKEKPEVDPTTTDDEDLESQCMAFLYIFIISRPFLFLFYPLDGGGRHKVDVGTENGLSNRSRKGICNLLALHSVNVAFDGLLNSAVTRSVTLKMIVISIQKALIILLPKRRSFCALSPFGYLSVSIH